MSRATGVAKDMVRRYGMSDIIGLRYIDDNEENVSEEMKCNMDTEISRLLNESYSRVLKTLTAHKGELDVIASALLLKKTLYADEIKSLIDDHLSKTSTTNDNEVKESNDSTLKEKSGSEESFNLLESNKT